uniref:L1 transposable element RRM domain-containing protein n=1 Tax=Amphilophus citrinellus TaxID=61819 RepID=A0A3Q0QVC5_AMPCI
MDSLKSDVAGRGSRIGEAENRVSQLEDENTQLIGVTAELKTKVLQLEARMQYQENYSGRNNLRIKGIPELSEKGKSVVECVKDVLRSLLPRDKDIEQIVIERVHRIPTAQKENQRDTLVGPRHILVRFLCFAERETIRLRARDTGTFHWKGSKVEFFPDFMKEIQDKRNKFFEVRRLCRAKGLKFTMQYPAVFWVSLGRECLRFADAAAAKKSIDKYQPPEEGE